jgi:hypothetical protein
VRAVIDYDVLTKTMKHPVTLHCFFDECESMGPWSKPVGAEIAPQLIYAPQKRESRSYKYVYIVHYNTFQVA